jgi:hypothetical protein
MKSYFLMRFKLISLLFTIGLLLCAISSNSAHAQQMLPGATAAAPPKTSSTVPPTKLHAVKITSPTKGQQIPIGSSFIVTGASSDNSNSNCQVSVIANGIKPYQPATASGPGGANDYSKWSIILSPKYTGIKEGENKITSSYICPSNPSLFASDTVNVTGVAAVTQAATATAAASDNTTTTSTATSSADNTTHDSGSDSSKHNSGGKSSSHSSSSSHDGGGGDGSGSSHDSGGGKGDDSGGSSSHDSNSSHDSGGGSGSGSSSKHSSSSGGSHDSGGGSGSGSSA